MFVTALEVQGWVGGLVIKNTCYSIRVGFPASTSGGWHLQVTATPGDLAPSSGLYGHWTQVVTLRHKHLNIFNIKKKKNYKVWMRSELYSTQHKIILYLAEHKHVIQLEGVRPHSTQLQGWLSYETTWIHKVKPFGFINACEVLSLLVPSPEDDIAKSKITWWASHKIWKLCFKHQKTDEFEKLF